VYGIFYGNVALEDEAYRKLSVFFTDLPEVRNLPQHKALRLVRKYLPLTTELNLAQNTTSPIVSLDFLNELAKWLSRQSKHRDLYDNLNNRLKNDVPKPLNYDTIYPNVLASN